MAPLPATGSQWRDLRKVLKPCNPDLDEDDYPQIDISDVSITDKAGNLASLLLANAKNVLTITGRLTYSKAVAKHFIHRPTGPIPVIYDDVSSFSYDDQLELWALSHAGWLHVTSSARPYLQLLQSMKKVVEQIYFIVDNKDKDWNMKEWAKHWKDESQSLDFSLEQAALSFAENADVFHLELEKHSTERDKNAIIYRYLKEKAPLATDYRAQGRVVKKTEASSKASSVTTVASPNISKRDLNRSKKRDENCIAAEDREDAPQEMAALWDQKDDAAILWKFAMANLKTWSYGELFRHVYDYFLFDSEPIVHDYLAYQAGNLLKYMNKIHDGKRIFPNTRLYKDLSGAKISSKTAGKMAKIALRPRDPAAWDLPMDELELHESTDEELESEEEGDEDDANDSEDENEDTDEDEDEDKDEDEDEEDEDEEDEDEEDEDEEEEDEEDEEDEEQEEKVVPIASSMLRPRMPKAVKRFTRNLDDIAGDERSQAISKRKKLHDEDDDDLNRTHETGQKDISVRWKEARDMDLFSTVHKEPLLDPNAIDEDGNWQCNQVDCLHIVYAAETDLGQELVKMHIFDHENDQMPQEVEPELDVIMRERHATRMPVSNLLKRIREFTSARSLADAIAGADHESALEEEKAIKPIKKLYA